MKLIAKRTFTYGTRHLVAGDAFETEKELDGKLLIVGRKAKKAAGPGRPRKPVPEPVVEHPIVEEHKAEEPVAEVAPPAAEVAPGAAPDQSEASRPGRPLPRTAHPFRGRQTP